MSEKVHWTDMFLWVVGFIVSIITLRIFAGEDGKLDNKEFAGAVCTFLLVWMIYQEGTRDHEYHLFSEWWIGLVGLLNLLLLGFKDIVKSIVNIKTKKDHE